jgi:hypothetical protein
VRPGAARFRAGPLLPALAAAADDGRLPAAQGMPTATTTICQGRDQRRTPTASRYSPGASMVPSPARLNCLGTSARSALN